MAEAGTDPGALPDRGQRPELGDPLAELRGHVRTAQQAAERLAREAERRRPSADPLSAQGARGPAAPTTPGEDPFVPPPPGAGAKQRADTPPSGWQEPAAGGDSQPELHALIELLESLRALLPDELREQLNDLIRQVLLILRALIDWLVGRMERESPPSGHGDSLEDIPII